MNNKIESIKEQKSLTLGGLILDISSFHHTKNSRRDINKRESYHERYEALNSNCRKALLLLTKEEHEELAAMLNHIIPYIKSACSTQSNQMYEEIKNISSKLSNSTILFDDIKAACGSYVFKTKGNTGVSNMRHAYYLINGVDMGFLYEFEGSLRQWNPIIDYSMTQEAIEATDIAVDKTAAELSKHSTNEEGTEYFSRGRDEAKKALRDLKKYLPMFETLNKIYETTSSIGDYGRRNKMW